MYIACLAAGVQALRDGIDAHDTAQILPVFEIVHIRPIVDVELLHEGILEFLVGRLPFQIVPAPTRLFAKTIEFQ